MDDVRCDDCQFYNCGICEELGEYVTPGKGKCSWFAPRVNKNRCVAENGKSAKQAYLSCNSVKESEGESE